MSETIAVKVEEVKALEPGDRIPEFRLKTQRESTTSLAAQALGKFVVLVFCKDLKSRGLQTFLSELLPQYDRADRMAHFIFLTRETTSATAIFAERMTFPFPIMTDSDGSVFAGYGVPSGGEEQLTCVLADANRQLLRIDSNCGVPGYAAQALDYLADIPQPTPIEVGRAAPVLYVARVLDPSFCQELIRHFETQGHRDSEVMHGQDAGQEQELVNYGTKVRSDHLIGDPALGGKIGRHLKARVLPEIQKAFHYRVTGLDWLKIGCYEADRQGFFAPHRDDTAPRVAHRRFAMTLNLNTGDYEGGHLRFPEYGPHLYRPAAGDAVIFSCSLVHEVLPVTAGRRFALISFFHGSDAEN